MEYVLPPVNLRMTTFPGHRLRQNPDHSDPLVTSAMSLRSISRTFIQGNNRVSPGTKVLGINISRWLVRISRPLYDTGPLPHEPMLSRITSSCSRSRGSPMFNNCFM
jgi:hypothetical protein